MRRLVRISTNVDKTTMLDSILHLFRIHLIRQDYNGKWYCRLCNKEINFFN